MKIVSVAAFCAVLVLPAIMFPLRAGAAPAQDSGAVFKDVAGKEWFLSEVRNSGNTVTIDRQKLAADNMGGSFSITFNENQVNGMGAPNRFFAPFTTGSNNSLGIGNLASTMMFAFKEPEGLNEKEYFDYLSKVTRWNLRDGQLELFCTVSDTVSDRSDAVLVFTLK